MPSLPLRLVLDTNVLLAGLVSRSSASQMVADSLKERRAVPLLSRPVLDEYRAVLSHPAVTGRFPHLTPRRVKLSLRRLRYVGDEYDPVRARFEFPRDPRDAMFVELAIVGNASHLVTMDDDLLSLPTARTDAGRRFRQRLRRLRVQTPQSFIEQWGTALGLG